MREPHQNESTEDNQDILEMKLGKWDGTDGGHKPEGLDSVYREEIIYDLGRGRSKL